MRCAVSCLALLAVVACAKTDESAEAAADSAARAAIAPISLSAVAGRWSMMGYNSAGDSLVGYELTATSDTAGWTITFPGRPAIPVRVATVGPRLVVDAGPYESVLRRRVQVTTHGTLQLAGDSLYGTTIARYSVTTADSVLNVRVVGRRIAP